VEHHIQELVVQQTEICNNNLITNNLIKYLYKRIIGEKWPVHRNQDLTELQ